jgi:hypothetical protein
MHKILIQTELPRLRSLGLEVFCPAYDNKSSQHQSAANGWTKDQPTTLPPDVFATLSKTNFFYQELSPQILALLNQYFDAVIVTIDPAWLIELLKGYKGKLIYRTYGHVENMSEYLFKHNAFRAIVERDNFWYMPHSLECALHEQSWLRDRMTVVPYCVTNDVLPIQDQWVPQRAEIMISCPNIANPYYQAHYEYLKKYFSDPQFRFYGVQTSQTTDPQLVGTIPFAQLLEAYKTSAAFLYTYREPTVCFLPPIEMMIAGGPVIYLAGSLLDQYFPPTAPGRARDESEANAKCRRLLSGDKEFLSEILASQKSVRARYLPNDVWPIFDRAFLEILNPATSNRGSAALLHPNASAAVDAIDAYTENVKLRASQIQELVLQQQSRNFLLLCYLEDLPFWWDLLNNPKNVHYLAVEREVRSIPDKILYPAGTKPSKLVFACTHPRWVVQKLKSILMPKISSVLRKIRNTRRDFYLFKAKPSFERLIIFDAGKKAYFEALPLSAKKIILNSKD